MKYLISMQYRNKNQTTKFHFNSFIFIWRLIKFSYSSVLKLGLLKNFKQKNFDSIAFHCFYLFAPVIIEHPIYVHIQAEVLCEFGLWNPARKLSLPLNNPHIEHAWLFRSGFKSIFSPPFVLILFFKGDRSVSASSTLKNRIARGGKGDGRGKSERKLHPSSTGSAPFLGETTSRILFYIPRNDVTNGVSIVRGKWSRFFLQK